jgi:hypothetical protein
MAPVCCLRDIFPAQGALAKAKNEILEAFDPLILVSEILPSLRVIPA